MYQPQANRFQTWPKVELHRHLPGAIRFETGSHTHENLAYWRHRL